MHLLRSRAGVLWSSLCRLVFPLIKPSLWP